MKNSNRFAVVFIGEGHGYNHINTRLNTAQDFDNIREGSLPWTVFNDVSSHIAFNIQYNREGGEGYGHQPALNDVFNMPLEDAEEALKLLRKVTKGYRQRLQDSSRRGETLMALIAFLEAGDVSRVYVRHENSTGFRQYSTTEAIYVLTGVDAKFKAGPALQNTLGE